MTAGNIFVGKKFPRRFIQVILNVFLIFHVKGVAREIERKVVMEHVFCMDRDFKEQLWSPPFPINSAQSWFINSGMARTPESPHPLREKLC